LHVHRRASLNACVTGVSAPQVQARPPMAVTNAVSWRSEGIRYKKNEVRVTLREQALWSRDVSTHAHGALHFTCVLLNNATCVVL
jgi:hypothetical protein